MIDMTQVSATLSALDSAIEHTEKLLAEATLNNKDYMHWKHQHNRIIALSEEAQQELLDNSKLLKSLEVSYDKHKKTVKENLEASINNTLNTWYTGEHYDMEIQKSVVGRTENHYLVDKAICSDLATICGGSATQVSGSLILTALLSGENSNFVFFDEAFSNTDEMTAKEIGKLLSYGLNNIQIILIENKVELTKAVKGLQYYLHYTKEEGTGVIKVRDDYDELEVDSPYQAVNDPSIEIDLTNFKTEKEESYILDSPTDQSNLLQEIYEE